MFHNNGESYVTVSRTKLIDKIKENLAAHQEKHREMCEGYQVLVEEANERFQGLLNEAFSADKPEKIDHAGLYQKAFAEVPKPQDYSKQYQDAIELLEWTMGEQVQLSIPNFRTWVLDEWSWKNKVELIHERTFSKAKEYRSRMTG